MSAVLVTGPTVTQNSPYRFSDLGLNTKKAFYGVHCHFHLTVSDKYYMVVDNHNFINFQIIHFP